MSDEPTIRIIRKEDCASIIELSNQLGYQPSSIQVSSTIDAILSDDQQWAFVATKKNKVIGFIHAYFMIRLTSAPFIEITGLVVAKPERNQGVGKLLVKQVEDECAKSLKVRVRCNNSRFEAHQFYQNAGYSSIKEQVVFIK